MSTPPDAGRSTLFRVEEIDDPPAPAEVQPAGAPPAMAMPPAAVPLPSQPLPVAAPPVTAAGPPPGRETLFRVEEVEEKPKPGPDGTAGATGLPRSPVMISELDDTRPVTPTEPARAPVPPPPPAEGSWRLPMVLAISLVTLAMVLAVDWVVGLVAQGSLLALPAALGVACCVGTAAVLAWREVQSLRRLRDAEEVRSALLAPGEPAAQRDRMLAGIRRWSRDLAAGQLQAAQVFLADVAEERSAVRIQGAFERSLLFPADDQALAAVHRAAYDMFFLVAVSPTALTDTAVFTARAMRMISEVATCYGARPGRLAQLRIGKRALADVALVSAATIAAGAAAQGIGDVLKEMGSRTAQVGALTFEPVTATVGMAAGTLLSAGGAVVDRAGGEIAGATTACLRIAQLGLLVMHTTRPLPLDAKRQVLLAAELRGRILTFRRNASPPA